MDESNNERSLQEQLDALKRENQHLREQLNQQETNFQFSDFQFSDIKEWLKGLWSRVQAPLGKAQKKVEPTIREKPIVAILVAFGAGFILSRLIGRR
jgi:ElaB/YqjD/DUF883 family membrane-anchored ribosome-binding protein